MMKFIGRRRAKGTRNKLNSWCVNWYGKGDRVGRIVLFKGSRRQDDEFIYVGRTGCMCFSSSNHDSIRAFLDNMHIIVGMFLLGWQERTVSFDVRLRNGQTQIFLFTFLYKLPDTLPIFRTQLVVHLRRHQIKCEKSVAPDLFYKQDNAVPQSGRSLDHFAPIQQICPV